MEGEDEESEDRIVPKVAEESGRTVGNPRLWQSYAFQRPFRGDYA